MTQLQVVRRKFRMLAGSLNERSRRLWAAAEAQALGHGGASLVAPATGISRSTIIRGLKESRTRSGAEAGRVRRPGGGRKSATVSDPHLADALESLVEPVSRGDPESPLRWTCKSTRVLGQELAAQNHQASDWKWNKIEHRLFSFISQNWRGRPLLTHATIVKLIANTRTSTGLKVRCVLDRRRYPKEVKVTDKQMATIRLRPHPFHGDWNYSIRPHRK